MIEVLVGDEDLTTRRRLATALYEAGHRVLEASSGPEAIGLTRDHVFDVIVCDVALPRGDGLGVFRHVRREAPGTAFILTAADMAKLCGLEPKNGADTIRRWEVTGPSGPAGKLLGILAMASDRHPILENFNVFDRWDVDEKERPARREAFREKMRNEIRERLV